ALAVAKKAVETGPERIAEGEAAKRQAMDELAKAHDAVSQAAVAVEESKKKLDALTATWLSTKA
ncbi:MAG TPA: hypothetical protein VHV77_02550, partial [Pirellulales bacterium]|nr:hypothetical protein [Pirellulales bacterium]